MSLFNDLAQQQAMMAEKQREALKTNSSFVFSKILGKEVKITEKKFAAIVDTIYTGNVTDVYEEYIELNNNKLISTKFISSIEIL